MNVKPHSSVDEKEIRHFAKDSANWWDENGPFRPLHRLNPVRLRYIRDRLAADPASLTPLKGLKILDIGCGGGLVCEPLTRLGASMTGIDADETAIATARAHAASSGLSIDYRTGAAEDVKGRFDIVLALEIVEHVADLNGFIASCVKLCKPGGQIILSTLNRTPKSYALGIIAAEHILRWVPRGTHDWKKFVKPSELAASLRAQGAEPVDMKGYIFNIMTGEFELSTNLDVNYFITARLP